MCKIETIIVMLILVITSLMSISCNIAEPAATAEVTVTLKTLSNSAIGATVTLTNNGSPVNTYTMAAIENHLEFTDIPFGIYTVKIVHDDFEEFIFEQLNVQSVKRNYNAMLILNETNEIYFTIGTSGIFWGSAPYGTFLIKNHRQLKETFEDPSIEWVDDIPIWERYSSDFFNENALLLYAFYGSGDNAPEFEVERLVKEGKTLTIYIIQHGMTEGLMLFSITILIEVNKVNVTNVENIEIITQIIYDEDGGD
ncbi:MAG: carboxypeptidase-like regulatory domain-containing protein [Candidatus Cloacimonetes bacterium]|nr:carboxypeptidase-like regulatory domain-containing protein [Candidatus Cloacimonadota bacterium]